MKYLDKIDWLCSLLAEMNIGSSITIAGKKGVAVIRCIPYLDGKMFSIDVGDYHYRHKSIFHTARQIYH